MDILEIASEADNRDMGEVRSGLYDAQGHTEIVRPRQSSKAKKSCQPEKNKALPPPAGKITSTIIAAYARNHKCSITDALLAHDIDPASSKAGAALKRHAARMLLEMQAEHQSAVAARAQSVAEQYVSLREILYQRAQRGDVAAIKAWAELSAADRAQDDVPEQLAKEAEAALRGMAQEYAAQVDANTPPGRAVIEFVELCLGSQEEKSRKS